MLNIRRHLSRCDIAICGAGTVGLTAACALISNSYFSKKDILLLEKFHKPKIYDIQNPPANYSYPIYALTLRNKIFLEKIGVWQLLEKGRFKQVKKMHIWDSYSNASLTFDEINENKPLMFIIEQNLLNAALLSYISSFSNVKFLYNQSNIKYSIADDVHIALNENDVISTQLLIGADGYNSEIRKLMNPPIFEWDYRQSAIVATLNLNNGNGNDNNYDTNDSNISISNDVAWQKFTPHGVIALLPLNDHQSSLVWSVPSGNVHGLDTTLMSLDEESFVDRLNAALWDNTAEHDRYIQFQGYLDRILDMAPILSIRKRRLNTMKQLPPRIMSIEPGSRAILPLKFLYSSRLVGPRIALIGDACRRIHPLAGQGLNLGIGDVECLTRILSHGQMYTTNLGSEAQLKKYQTERLRATFPIITAINSLNLIYNSPCGNDFSSEFGKTNTFDSNNLAQNSNELWKQYYFPNVSTNFSDIFRKIKLPKTLLGSFGLQMVDSSPATKLEIRGLQHK